MSELRHAERAESKEMCLFLIFARFCLARQMKSEMIFFVRRAPRSGAKVEKKIYLL